MIRVLELFAGIGACSKALERLDIEHEIVDAVEIDKYAIASFNAIHGTNFEPQDITKWDKDIECDLIMHGSPCQDFSVAGLGAGGDKDSGTRSSLMYETLRIVEKLNPKYVIWENVKNLLSRKHRHNFDAYQEAMERLGYKNYYKVLNAKDYGVPQNRERVFTVSIQEKERKYEWPSPIPLERRLKDMLEEKVDEKYYVSIKQLTGMATTNYASYKLSKLLKGKNETADTIKARFEGCPQMVSTGGTELQREVCDEALKKGLVKPNDVMNTLKTHPQGLGVTVETQEEPFIVASRGRNPENPNDRTVGNPTKQRLEPKFDGVTNTITTVQKDNYVATPYRIRKLTPRECFRLMGFTDQDYNNAAKVCSDTQLYKQVGNSIVVNVLEGIIKNLI